MFTERESNRLNYVLSSIVANPQLFHTLIAIIFNSPVEGNLRVALDVVEEEFYVEFWRGALHVQNTKPAFERIYARLMARHGVARHTAFALSSAHWMVRGETLSQTVQ